MPEKSSKSNAVSVSSIALSAISFLADIIALGQVTYGIITRNDTENLALKLIAIVLVFLLGFGLGSLGLRGVNRDSVEKVLQVYVWGYLILACLSYLGIVGTFRRPYSFMSYVAFIIILALQLVAFTTLRSVSQVKPIVSHALALMTVSVIHALLFLYQFVFVSIPDLIYVIGEWLFWFGWTMYAVPMIRIAFANGGKKSGLR